MRKTLQTIGWMFRQARPVLGHLILILSICGIGGIVSVFTSLVTKAVIDAASNHSSKLYQYLLLLGGIFVLQIILKICDAILSTYCSNKFANTLQQKLYQHILHSKWQAQNTYHSANIITRLTSDLSTLNTFVTRTLPTLVSLTCTLITAFFTLLYLEPVMALAALVISPFSILMATILGRRVKKYYVAYQEENVKHRSFLQESLQNMIVTKSFCEEDNNLATLKAIHKRKFTLSLKQTYLGTLSTTFLMLGAFSGYFIVFVWGASHLGTAGYFGTLTALIQLFSNIQSPLNGLAHYFPGLITAHASSQRLMLLEELPLEENLNLPALKQPDIVFEDVSFCYKEDVPVIQHASCHFKSGEIIGLIGSSGVGKTTLIRLVLSLIEPTHGHIFIEDCGKRYPVCAGLRKYISYVPQGNTMFSGTIASNLLHGKPSATSRELEEALKSACISSFIATLPEGLNTQIGEKGLGLSEGQAQRLALARAFLRKKPILILDEATSALDAATELNLLENISSLDYHPTCLIITHRHSTLSICDKVFSLKENCLTQELYHSKTIQLYT